MKSVYSAVRTGPLNKAVCASSLEGYGCVFGILLMCYNYIQHSGDVSPESIDNVTFDKYIYIPTSALNINNSL